MRAPSQLMDEAIQLRRKILEKGRNPDHGWLTVTLDEATSLSGEFMVPGEACQWKIAGLRLVITDAAA